MSAATPAAGEPPSRPDRTPSMPDEVWERFLADTEERIRASAPREPAARDRLPSAARTAHHGAPSAAGRRRGGTVWNRWLRPVVVLLVIALLALLTFYPATVLSWVDALFGIKPGGTACATALYDAKCRAGELRWNSGVPGLPGVVALIR